jgi:hypothetical protein
MESTISYSELKNKTSINYFSCSARARIQARGMPKARGIFQPVDYKGTRKGRKWIIAT